MTCHCPYSNQIFVRPSCPSVRAKLRRFLGPRVILAHLRVVCYMADDVAEFSRSFAWNFAQPLDFNANTCTQAPADPFANSLDAGFAELFVGGEQHARLAQALLDDLELPYAGNVPYHVNQRQAMHYGTVLRDDEIGRPALNLF